MSLNIASSKEKSSVLDINKYMWTENGYTPKVYAQIYHDKKNFFTEFKIFEKNPRAAFDNHFSPVHTDSCVEWFVNFTPEKYNKYFNFEVNSKGAMFAGYQKDRFHGKTLAPSDIHDMNIVSKIHDDFWSVTYKIPEILIKKYQPEFSLKACTYIKMNLYKCGDKTEFEHYGALFPINSETPDFHRPECFKEVMVL